MANRILRMPEVIERTGVSRSAIYLAIKAKTFPKPIKLSERCIGFVEAEIDNWIDQTIIQSRQEVAA